MKANLELLDRLKQGSIENPLIPWKVIELPEGELGAKTKQKKKKKAKGKKEKKKKKRHPLIQKT